MKWPCGVLACIALAACGPKAPGETGASGARDGEHAPRHYEAISKTAEAFTGALDVTDIAPAAIRIVADSGHVYEARLVSAGRGGDKVGVTAWTSIMPIPEDAAIALDSVTSELVNAKAANGGWCSPEKTRFLALASYEEGGAHMMQIAAFSDDAWPPARTPQLCGTFTYQRAPAKSAP
jgi:hypothetical protein